jgi:hypothetical protein
VRARAPWLEGRSSHCSINQSIYQPINQCTTNPNPSVFCAEPLHSGACARHQRRRHRQHHLRLRGAAGAGVDSVDLGCGVWGRDVHTVWTVWTWGVGCGGIMSPTSSSRTRRCRCVDIHTVWTPPHMPCTRVGCIARSQALGRARALVPSHSPTRPRLPSHTPHYQAETVGKAITEFSPGVRLPAVPEGSPARLSGLQSGDVVLTMDGWKVRAGHGRRSLSLDVNEGPLLLLAKLGNRGHGRQARPKRNARTRAPSNSRRSPPARLTLTPKILPSRRSPQTRLRSGRRCGASGCPRAATWRSRCSATAPSCR